MAKPLKQIQIFAKFGHTVWNSPRWCFIRVLPCSIPPHKIGERCFLLLRGGKLDPYCLSSWRPSDKDIWGHGSNVLSLSTTAGIRTRTTSKKIHLNHAIESLSIMLLQNPCVLDAVKTAKLAFHFSKQFVENTPRSASSKIF